MCVSVQDAVLLALSFDMTLASATANRPEDEPALKRSLWLTIACHIVEQHPSQDQVGPSCLVVSHRIALASARVRLCCVGVMSSHLVQCPYQVVTAGHHCNFMFYPRLVMCMTMHGCFTQFCPIWCMCKRAMCQLFHSAISGCTHNQ